MTPSEAEAAIFNHIATMPGRPNVVFAGGQSKPMPRYVVQVSGGRRQTMGLTLATDATVAVVVRVETDADEAPYVNNNPLRDALIQRFAPGTKIGGVTIEDAPDDSKPPLVSSTVYAIPVTIRGRFFF